MLILHRQIQIPWVLIIIKGVLTDYWKEYNHLKQFSLIDPKIMRLSFSNTPIISCPTKIFKLKINFGDIEITDPKQSHLGPTLNFRAQINTFVASKFQTPNNDSPCPNFRLQMSSPVPKFYDLCMCILINSILSILIDHNLLPPTVSL